MRYFANPTRGTGPYMADGTLGFIDTPRQHNERPAGVVWCADNGCFSEAFNEHEWWQWLRDNAADAGSCAFATAPDVVGDAWATQMRSMPWLPRIRALGYPVAYVLQDGARGNRLPWGHFDALFIGGSTEYKLSREAAAIIGVAKRRGLYVHMGRVNSRKRYEYARAIGCDSVDGTYLTYGPDVNLPRLLSWVRAPEQMALVS